MTAAADMCSCELAVAVRVAARASELEHARANARLHSLTMQRLTVEREELGGQCTLHTS